MRRLIRSASTGSLVPLLGQGINRGDNRQREPLPYSIAVQIMIVGDLERKLFTKTDTLPARA